jgi:hypothetical protein
MFAPVGSAGGIGTTPFGLRLLRVMDEFDAVIGLDNQLHDEGRSAGIAAGAAAGYAEAYQFG